MLPNSLKTLNSISVYLWAALVSGTSAIFLQNGYATASPTNSSDQNNTTTLEQVHQYSSEGSNDSDTFAAVTSVSQISDIDPTNWAYQALQSLVERYGCIAGYPDGTFKGNRSMTRYEFAAGLNACLERINELIKVGTENLATKQDLATVRRLQSDFSTELATLRGQVDALSARTSTLEAQQFSTTTKLSGEAIFALNGATGTGQPNNPVVFQERVRLNFDTSFTGRDLLRTRIQAGNGLITLFRAQPQGARSAQGNLALNEGRFTYDGRPNTTDNSVALDLLSYRFPVNDKKIPRISSFIPSGQLLPSRCLDPRQRSADTAGVGRSDTARY